MNEISLRERNFASAGDEINLDGAINHGRPSSGGNWTVFRHAGASVSDGETHDVRHGSCLSEIPPRSLAQNHIWSPIKGLRLALSAGPLDRCYFRAEAKCVSSISTKAQRSDWRVAFERWARVVRHVCTPYVKRLVGGAPSKTWHMPKCLSSEENPRG